MHTIFIEKSRFFIMAVLLLAITACQSSNATSVAHLNISTAISATETPTSAFTKTPTPTPTPTSIPSSLDTLPASFEAHDFSVASGQFQIQITEILSMDQIGERKPSEGNQYFVLHGYIYNYSGEDQVFHDVDFQTEFNQGQKITPTVDLMIDLKQTQYPEAGYPDRNLFRYPDFIVPAHRAVEIVLAYEAPTISDHVKLYFNPNGVQPGANLGILLFKQSESNQYWLIKATADDVPQFTVTFVPAPDGETVTELIDSQFKTVDNCFSGVSRYLELKYEGREESEVMVVNESISDIGVGTSFRFFVTPTFRLMLDNKVREYHKKQDETELTISETHQLPAGPHERTNWEIQAYKVSLTGTMVITSGTQIFEVPYTIGDRIRVDVNPIPAEPCFDPTATP